MPDKVLDAGYWSLPLGTSSLVERQQKRSHKCDVNVCNFHL